MNTRTLVLIHVLLIVISMIIAGYYFPRLPDKMATHFNGNGEADGFMAKTTHVTFMACLQWGLFAMFGLFIYFGNKLPPSLINMPNKDYWLAPERRESTMVRMNFVLALIGIATQAFMMSIDMLVIDHNLGGEGMNFFWGLFAAYMIFTLAMVIWMYRAFRIPISTSDSGGERKIN